MPKFTKTVLPADDQTDIVSSLPEDTSNPLLQKLQKSYTDWEALDKCGLVPVALDCQAYQPFHGHDHSCHTHLRFTAETIKRHVEGDHGGGFQVYVRRSDGKPSPLWKALAEAGLEAVDFRCDICQSRPADGLRFHPSSILQHIKPHRGKLAKNQDYNIMKGLQPKAEGKLSFTIRGSKPVQVEEDEDQ